METRTKPDATLERLRALRSLDWDRADHRRRLEEEIMLTRTGLDRGFWTSKGALVVGLVLAGGLAGATTAAFVSEWIVTEVDLPGDTKHVTISDGQGVVIDEVVPDDTGFFAIEDDGTGNGALLQVRPVDEPPPEDAAPEVPPQKP